jgi:hypothetical protein
MGKVFLKNGIIYCLNWCPIFGEYYSTFPTGNENPLLSKTPSKDPAQMIGISGLVSTKYLRVLSDSGHS